MLYVIIKDVEDQKLFFIRVCKLDLKKGFHELLIFFIHFHPIRYHDHWLKIPNLGMKLPRHHSKTHY